MCVQRTGLHFKFKIIRARLVIFARLHSLHYCLECPNELVGSFQSPSHTAVYIMIYLYFLIVISVSAVLYLSTVKPKNYPPGPGWYPIKGSVSTLKQYVMKYGGLHKAFSKLAKDFNTNVLGLKLGQELVVVVFTYDVVKDVLRSEDYQSRPDNLFIRLRSMGTKKGITSADGELWSSQRNFLMRHFRNLGFGKEEMHKMVQDELNEVLASLEAKSSNVEIGKLLSHAVIGVLWNLTAGLRLGKENEQLDKVLDLLNRRGKVFDLSGGVLNMYPWLRFVIPERSGYNLMLKVNEEMKVFFMDIITEHYKNWTEGRQDDLIYAFITEMKNTPNSYFTEDQLVMICVDLIIAGAHTTSNTLDFAFLMMILHKDVQKKVHQELDKVFKEHQNIEYTSRISAPYVEAVLMEVERYRHVVPVIGPRRVLKDTVLEGYVIPKNTTVLISLQSVHMDKDYWKDPEDFRPERFLDDSGRLVVSDHLLPFGLGRRRCPGEALAKSCLFTFFATIMVKYSVSSPCDRPQPTGEPIPGITLFPENYVATFTKRFA